MGKIFLGLATAVIVGMQTYQQNITQENSQEIKELDRTTLTAEEIDAKIESKTNELLQQILQIEKQILANDKKISVEELEFEEYMNKNRKQYPQPSQRPKLNDK